MEIGQAVTEGQKLIVLDAMKMEIVAASPTDGIVEGLHCVQGALVAGGRLLASIKPTAT